VSSPAKRALATAKIVHKALAVEGLIVTQDQRLYQEGIERIKAVLAECPTDAVRVLLVGHNPELEDLLIYLVGAVHLPIPINCCLRRRGSVENADDWSHLDAAVPTSIYYPP